MSRRLRVGAVNYLNAKPLVEGLAELAPEIDLGFDLPSRLADRMARGEIDVGLIPVAEYLRAEVYSFIPDISIASRGAVLSVTLFSRVPWREIRTVALDEGSRSSAALTQILLRRKYGVEPIVEPLPMSVPADDVTTDAVLLIGDRAMRACLPGFSFAYDLGQEWTDWTGLPMVYALWAVREGINLGSTTLAFHKAKQLGLANAGAIAAREAPVLELDAGYCRRYLSHVIHYDLGPNERLGLDRYAKELRELGLAERPTARSRTRIA